MFRVACLAGLMACVAGVCSTSAIAQGVTATWVQKQPAQYYPGGPGPRGWSKLFYDTRSERIGLYGGSAGGGFKSDVWHYDIQADSWIGLEVPTLDCPGYLGPDGGPDGRDAHSSEYDPYNHLYWAVAGGGSKCGGSYGETLPVRTAGSGTSTTKVVDSNLTASATDYYKDWLVTVGNDRSYVTAYDPTSKTLTLATPITGLGAGKTYTVQFHTTAQTWYYSPTTRAWRSMEGPYWGSLRPSPVVDLLDRNTPGFAYSTKDNVIVYHGGGRNGAGSNDTWVLDLTTKRWTQKTLDSSIGLPLKLQELTSALVYDEANDVFILFGGRCVDYRCPYGKPSGDTWAYKLSTNTWTKMTPPVSPPPRTAGAMYYDRNLGAVVLFGGATTDIYNDYPTAAKLLNDLWIYRYSTNTWTQIPTAGGPTGRYLQMMAFDHLDGKAALYSGNTPTTTAEVWSLEISDPSANPLPVARVDATQLDGTATFNFSAARSFDRNGSIVSYVWDFGDGSTGSGIDAAHTYATAGVFPVRLTVTDSGGASATAWYRADASGSSGGGGGGGTNQPPIAVASVNPTSGTTSTTFSFSAAGSSDPDGSITSYQWNFGDGASASGGSATHQFANSGSYTVTLTVQDNSGATAATSLAITVSNPTPAPVISFQRQISGTVANGTVTQVLANGVAIPFTASGSSFTATLTSTSSQTVNVTIQATGVGGLATQSVTIAVP